MVVWQLVLGCAVAWAQPESNSLQVQRFEKALNSLATAYHLPGLSVAVLRDDRLLYGAGFGYADVEQGTPATPQTNYRIASLT